MKRQTPSPSGIPAPAPPEPLEQSSDGTGQTVQYSPENLLEVFPTLQEALEGLTVTALECRDTDDEHTLPYIVACFDYKEHGETLTQYVHVVQLPEDFRKTYPSYSWATFEI